MAWKEQLQRVTINSRKYIGGSFRGATFFVEDSSASGGRRGVVHEIPFSDEDPYIEDTGKKSKPFRVTAYTLGPNYLIEKNKLIDALEKGAGDLVHPYAGKMFAFPHSYEVSETPRSGGRASFSIEFQKTVSKTNFPSSKLDAVSSVKSRATTVLEVTRAATESRWVESTLRLNSDFLEPAEGLLEDLGRAMDRPFSPLLEGAQSLAQFRSRLDRLVNNAASLVLSPLGSFDAILDALSFAFRPPELPSAFVDLLNSFKTNGTRLALPPVATPNRDREKEVFDNQVRTIKTIGVVTVCGIASEAPFPTVDDAEKVRDKLVTELDDLIETAETDEEYQSIVDLQVDVIRALPSETRQTQRRLIFVPKVTTNSLVLAHRLYGDTSREQEIVELNRPFHPGFLIGQEPLTVLSDG